MSARGQRRRGPPLVVGAWAALLLATVALGVLGQADADPPPPSATPAAEVSAMASPTATPVPRPRALGPSTTRPPIGEDGVMGGLVFGTAFGWLQPAPTDP